MDAGFTLVTKTRAKLSKKQAEVITLRRPSASSTRPSAASLSRPTVSSTSKWPSVPSTYSDAVVPVRFSPVPEIRTYFQKSVSIPEALVKQEYDDPKITEVIKKAYPSRFFYIPKDLHKTRPFYDFILVDTKFVEITHIPSRDDPSKIAYSKLKNFKVMNPTYWNQEPYTDSNRLFFTPTHTETIRWHGSMLFGIKIKSTHGLSNFAKMLIKFIIHFGSSNGGKSLDKPKIYSPFQYRNPSTTLFKIYSVTTWNFLLNLRSLLYTYHKNWMRKTSFK